jgi:hypothetical protein
MKRVPLRTRSRGNARASGPRRRNRQMTGRPNRATAIRARSRASLSVLLAIVICSLWACGGSPGAAPLQADTQLKLVATSSEAISYYYPGIGTILNLPVYVSPTSVPFEMNLQRTSYQQEITAQQLIKTGQSTEYLPFPPNVAASFAGLGNFIHLVITGSAKKAAVDTEVGLCPTATKRLGDSAVSASPYPRACTFNPFAVGMVWGIPLGWGAPAVADVPIQLPPGGYTASITVSEAYQRLFGMVGDKATVHLMIRRSSSPFSLSSLEGNGTDPGVTPTVPPPPPSGARTASTDLLPDIEALPAWGIQMAESKTSVGSPQDLLQFSATVWNAGPTPLTVVGFRRPGAQTMDAFQYVRDAEGRSVASMAIGQLYYDTDFGHSHWHLANFASYRLLSADKKTILKSTKVGFCLTDTDSVDYLLRNAVVQPQTTVLATSCGGGKPTLRTVAMTLDVGNGDTYLQRIAGQSFDVTNLPDGVYYVEVVVNPDNSLHLSRNSAQVSMRKVLIGGKAGDRTVAVTPVGLVTSN